VSGCQALISTLGQPKGEGSIFSQATSNVIQSMNEFDVKRYVITTGLQVDTPFDNKGTKAKFATEWMNTLYPETTSDKQEEYNILCQSKVDWALARMPLIEQTDPRNKISVNLQDCPGYKISATDLAGFLIGRLFDETFIRKSSFIASA
jgi:hypothetical protein